MLLLLVQNEKHLVLAHGKPCVPVGWGMGLGAGLGQRKLTHGLWLICLTWLEIDSGCNSSPLGCGMGHTWPGEQEG